VWPFLYHLAPAQASFNGIPAPNRNSNGHRQGLDLTNPRPIFLGHAVFVSVFGTSCHTSNMPESQPKVTRQNAPDPIL
jgi:hypothetical protein